MKNLFIPLLACIACAVVVSFTAVSVRSTQELNLENDKKSKILLAAGINSENINEEFEKIKIIYVNFKSNELVEMDEKSFSTSTALSTARPTEAKRARS